MSADVLSSLDPMLRRKVQAVCKDVNGHPLNPVPAGWVLRPFEGHRSPARQAELYRLKRTTLKRSKHNLTPARACDVVWWHPAHGWSWSTAMPWYLVGRSAKAHELLWGGDWVKLKDCPHLELRGWK